MITMHIEVLTSESQYSFMSALRVQGGIRRIAVPEGFGELSIGEQIAGILPMIQAHYTEHRGRIRHFGAITGYRFHLGKAESYDFSIDGELLSMRLTE